MTDYFTILLQVVTGVFGPWLFFLLGVVAILVALLWSCFSSSEEAGFSGKIIALTWVGFVLFVLLDVSFMVWLNQFDTWTWTLNNSSTESLAW